MFAAQILIINTHKKNFMKKLLNKSFIGLLFVLTAGLVSCGSDDDNNDWGNEGAKSINIVVGKYKGTMDGNVYDATLTVERVDDTHVRVSVDKPDNSGQIPTSVVLTIPETVSGGFVQYESFNGFFSYQIDPNSIYVSTAKNSDSIITFYFKGEKIK